MQEQNTWSYSAKSETNAHSGIICIDLVSYAIFESLSAIKVKTPAVQLVTEEEEKKSVN